MSYFSTNFGFSTNDTVAIMGVHAGGQANTNNSGFQVKGQPNKWPLWALTRGDRPTQTIAASR